MGRPVSDGEKTEQGEYGKVHKTSIDKQHSEKREVGEQCSEGENLEGGETITWK